MLGTCTSLLRSPSASSHASQHQQKQTVRLANVRVSVMSHSLFQLSCLFLQVTGQAFGVWCVAGGGDILEEAAGGVRSGSPAGALPHSCARELQPPAGPHEPGLQAAGQPPSPGTHPAVLQEPARLHCARGAWRGGGDAAAAAALGVVFSTWLPQGL